jgi:predicted phage replisome organizer
MSEVKWIKITTNMFDDEKIKIIESMPDADAILVIWVKLLTLAGKCNEDGNVTLCEDIPFSDEMLATIFHRPLNTIRLALSVFEKYQMIEIADKNIQIVNWAKHQNIDGLDRIRENTRLRVAKHRQQKRLDNSKCNVSVTLRNATEKSRVDKNRIDKDIDNKAFAFLQNSDFNKTWQDYLGMRKAIKRPATSHAQVLTLKKLHTYTIGTAIKMMEQSIEHSWQAVYPLRKEQEHGKYQRHDREDRAKALNEIGTEV